MDAERFFPLLTVSRFQGKRSQFVGRSSNLKRTTCNKQERHCHCIIVVITFISAPPALLPRDQVPQDAQDRVRPGQDGEVRQGGGARHEGGGAESVPVIRGHQAQFCARLRRVQGPERRSCISGESVLYRHLGCHLPFVCFMKTNSFL
jgi:hypothetical protein